MSISNWFKTKKKGARTRKGSFNSLNNRMKNSSFSTYICFPVDSAGIVIMSRDRGINQEMKGKRKKGHNSKIVKSWGFFFPEKGGEIAILRRSVGRLAFSTHTRTHKYTYIYIYIQTCNVSAFSNFLILFFYFFRGGEGGKRGWLMVCISGLWMKPLKKLPWWSLACNSP